MVNEFEEENQEILLAFHHFPRPKLLTLNRQSMFHSASFEILFRLFMCDMKNKIHCGKKLGNLQIICRFGYLPIANYAEYFQCCMYLQDLFCIFVPKFCFAFS